MAKKATPPAHATRAHGAMRKRLRLLCISGRPATVAQISATYAAMSTSKVGHGASEWATLLQLAQAAIGVLDVCRACGGNGTVSQPFQHVACPNCQAVHQKCDCGVDRKRPPGFQRVPCGDYAEGALIRETCHGTGQRRICNPAPDELCSNTMGPAHAELANRLGTPDLMAQVAAVLAGKAGMTV